MSPETDKPKYPYYLANQARYDGTALPVTDKYDGQTMAFATLADAAAFSRGIAAAQGAEAAMRDYPSDARQAVLDHCVRRFTERQEGLAATLCREAGKPLQQARTEVARLIETFRIAAEEAIRTRGETLDMAISPRSRGYRGMWKHVPIGACGFISPFNFPLNLAAHKIAPAIAAGCPFVLKPASQTPLSALMIADALAETDLPTGAFSIMPATRAVADQLVTDPRLRLLSFTGSPQVGWDMKARCGQKKIVLELGGNAACIVDADQGGELDQVAERLAFGGFYQSGQSCIHVQRVLVHESLYEDLKSRLLAHVRALPVGDPREERTFVGPLIDEGEAARVQSWVEQALARGARLLCGGTRRGAFIEPTLLENVDRDQRVYRDEVFGPVVTLSPFNDFRQALREVNDSIYGLQAGVFTHDVRHTMLAWDTLEVGGVIIGDIPSFRADHMPYGGVKASGLGREGVRFAIQEMSEVRLLVIKDRATPTA